MKTTRCLSLFAISVLVSGCGGGGDGDGAGPATAPPAATSVALSAAFANIVNQNRSSPLTISGSATVSGQTVNMSGSGTLSESTGAGTFEGVTGLRKTTVVNGSLVASIGSNSTSAPLSSTTQEFFDSNYKPLGVTAEGSYCVTTSFVPVPSTSSAAASRAWFTQDCFASSAKLARLATVSVSYSVEAESGGNYLLKLLSTATAADGVTVPSTRTYRVTPAGAVTRLTDVAAFSLSGVTFALTTTYR